MINSIQGYLDYKPYFVKYDAKKYGIGGVKIYYETSFFCNENKLIHQNLKQLFSCKPCISEKMIEEYGEDKFKELIKSL